ncbi:hypothetical protein BOX15_Mlig004506g2 [Macrostomum lignano]|uniref:mRNA-decapping enzyme C-terminal domain-containing protein n=1 Tax=Macrostomum lignano TaxID=282301 RepID=A0A267EBE0_9PLAT|nr:hypothetical protein BOX15_Mlig004506g2 [Macrostomum lignano]
MINYNDNKIKAMTSSSPAALPPLPLSRVQQADPACTELLELSLGPCDFYMRGTDGLWTKCLTERDGEQVRLVLYSRSGSPRHALAVIGCGPTDRLQPLASAAAADWPRAQPPFLLFGSGQWGVWFRDEADCQRMAKRLAQLADGAAEVATAQQAETGDGALSASESIVEMLGRAQAQYEATAAAGQGAQACEMVARRIREQLGLAQPEDNAVAAAEASPGSADINVDTRAAAETGGLAAGCQWREIGPASPPPVEEEFLLTPGMLESPRLPPPQRSQPDGEDTFAGDFEAAPTSALTGQMQDLLRDSLTRLLDQDDALIGLLHQAYIASLQKRLSSV